MEFGSYLKELREQSGLTMSEIHLLCGITNSRLNREENGKRTLKADEIKKLAKAYNASTVFLFQMAGLLDNEDLAEYQQCFENLNLLNNEEKQVIQSMINLLVKNKVGIK